MHRTRLITGVIGAIIVIALVGWGNLLLFWLLVSSATVLGLKEFYDLAKGGQLPSYPLPGILMGWLLSLAPLLAIGIRKDLLILFAVTLAAWALFMFALFAKQPLPEAMTALAVTMFGIMYVSWFFMHLTLLRGLPYGKQYVFYLLILIWVGDSGAYYAGKSLGKHPLSPIISPKKTIEGAIGGTAATLLASVIAKYTFLPHISLLHALTLGLLLAIVAQIGDLCESLLKRSVNVKDSGTLLPGHGGILDRVDGLIFAAPVLYYYAQVFLVA
ncbi:phosphatidate cytidylyltransferase [Candidatus Moduliflexus flocculans]|uniref:Phosphatidate cytidylyltransferase n=1 Tax=Candidatus Moduliflexus flocculans TaxID=1499966 RepID=A0A081BSI6_9BACT|nr:phosphatidate cytidylyltransferase [Candidatus Moduliflexus flocculans]